MHSLRSSPPGPTVFWALPLALIAVAYLVYQSIRRPGPTEAFKALLLALAFLLWAANQYWPDAACATLLNDLAIALFVLDVFFVIAGWPATSPDESFAESYIEPGDEPSGLLAGRQGVVDCR